MRNRFLNRKRLWPSICWAPWEPLGILGGFDRSVAGFFDLGGAIWVGFYAHVLCKNIRFFPEFSGLDWKVFSGMTAMSDDLIRYNEAVK